jgi:hypothetical protein
MAIRKFDSSFLNVPIYQNQQQQQQQQQQQHQHLNGNLFHHFEINLQSTDNILKLYFKNVSTKTS